MKGRKKVVIQPPTTPVLIAPLKPTIWQSRVPALATTMALTVLGAFAGLVVLVQLTGEIAYDSSSAESEIRADIVAPFPVGVDPRERRIVEDPTVDTYLGSTPSSYLAQHLEGRGVVAKMFSRLASIPWYQNLATPGARILIVEPGERHEQVVQNFGRILGWSTEEKKRFVSLVASSSPELGEGKYFPGTYVTARDATPEQVARLVIRRFSDEVVARYDTAVSDHVPLEDTLIIASLLEREAREFQDMRLISGVIWNRLFAGMKLQLDATMQYAKADTESGAAWWSTPRPEDKDIDSPYNTYLYEGLPPTAIANPSLAAILAALNPKKTDCMFYFHDEGGNLHCSKDYQGHVDGLTEIYGQGR